MEKETLSDTMRPLGWTPAIVTGILAILVAVGLTIPLPERELHVEGTWIADGHRLTVARLTAATLDSVPGVLEGRRGNRYCLRVPPRNSNCRILTVSHDSATLQWGYSTLLEPGGDSIRVFRRAP